MKEEVITLSQKEITKHSIIKDLLDGKLKNKEAARLLNLSVRQVIRLRKKVKRDGLKGIIHGNTGKPPVVAICRGVKDTILNLYSNTYKDYNCSHFKETLEEEHGISVSREFIRTLLLNANLRTKSRKRPKHRARRDRMPREGLLIQMDTSEHDWFFGRAPVASLIAAIDDATGEVPYALFVDSDSTVNNMQVMRELILNKGLPAAFYVDRASHFKTTRHSSYRVNLTGIYEPTQIKMALSEIGINLILANSPQAKGRIERLFKTFQDRLLKEMRVMGISNIKDANKYLHKTFLPKYNSKFAISPKEATPAYRPLPNHVDLDAVFSIREERTVMADNTLSFKNRIFQILPDDRRYSYAKAKVTVEVRLDSTVHIKYKEYYLNVKELKTVSKPDRMLNTLPEPITRLLQKYPVQKQESDIFTLQRG